MTHPAPQGGEGQDWLVLDFDADWAGENPPQGGLGQSWFVVELDTSESPVAPEPIPQAPPAPRPWSSWPGSGFDQRVLDLIRRVRGRDKVQGQAAAKPIVSRALVAQPVARTTTVSRAISAARHEVVEQVSVTIAAGLSASDVHERIIAANRSRTTTMSVARAGEVLAVDKTIKRDALDEDLGSDEILEILCVL